MDENKDNMIIEIEENEYLEIKKGINGLPEDIWETYSAFANTNGGAIILGLEEISQTSYRIVGIKNPEKLKSDFFNIVNNKSKVNRNILDSDSIEINEISGFKIMKISVPAASYNQKPIYLKDNPKILIKLYLCYWE